MISDEPHTEALVAVFCVIVSMQATWDCSEWSIMKQRMIIVVLLAVLDAVSCRHACIQRPAGHGGKFKIQVDSIILHVCIQRPAINEVPSNPQ